MQHEESLLTPTITITVTLTLNLIPSKCLLEFLRQSFAVFYSKITVLVRRNDSNKFQDAYDQLDELGLSPTLYSRCEGH